ncbi:MAG: formylglycine-generating enzyme family protein [SAR324 cluster bacterium]|nr:formylglycine-generating enzyme family protein [SAR324 cluster bacterium]
MAEFIQSWGGTMRFRHIWLVTTFLLLLLSPLFAQRGVTSGGTKPPAKAAEDSFREPVMGMVFRWVPGGSFEMGCHANAGDCHDREKPVHTVRVEGFWMGTHEVTQGQWKNLVGSNPSKFKRGDNYPVEQVDWNDVGNFITKLNLKSMHSSVTFRLPTEAEWEYACRSGGKPVKYAWGNGEPGTGGLKQGNLADNRTKLKWRIKDHDDGYAETSPIGSYSPNGLGLHDMSGNVREWVRDKKIAYSKGGRKIPVRRRSSGSSRIFRGGSWLDPSGFLRCSDRGANITWFNYDYLGFRLVAVKKP